jgi:hypothetical protein
MSRPSRVATKTFPSQTATPRLTTSQQALTAHSGGTFGSKDHNFSPVAAFTANTLLQAVVKYITPSTTSGVDSWPRCASRSRYHVRASWPTLLSLTCLSGLKRCSLRVRP